MQLTLAQLRKLSFPYSMDEQLDLSNELAGFEDILSVSLADVHTVIRERGRDTYLCNFHINVELTLEDSVSLKPVSYPIEMDAEEIFTTDVDMDDVFLIEGITMNTKEAILTNILCEKPMSYTLEDFESDPEPEEEEEAEEKINPAFASLADLL